MLKKRRILDHLWYLLFTIKKSDNKFSYFQMGNESVSRFSDNMQWTTVSKKGCKEVIQSKSTREVVEKYTLDHIESQEIKRQDLIYSWRTHKKSAKFIVQIQEMKYMQTDEEPKCFFELCHRDNQANHKLVVFTEQIHKLYQNNPRFNFTQKDQVRLFLEIIYSIQHLSQKFGYFVISKEMVGFNSKMVGKAWINQNFASNYVQYKKEIHSKSEREKWQSSIIESIIDICRLCTTEMNSKSNKFTFVIAQIRNYRLLTFQLFIKFARNMLHQNSQMEGRESLSVQKRMSSGQKSHKIISNQCSNSKNEIMNSNGKQSIKEVISSTKDCKETKIIKEKKFVMVPVVNIKKIYPVTEQERLLINERRRSDRFSSDLRQRSLIVSPIRQNYVEVHRHAQSFSKEVKQINQIKSEVGRPLDSIMQFPTKNVKQFNEASDINQDSSMIESPHQRILMVDSMIVVENQAQNQESFRKNTKIILEQSFVLRGNQSN